VAGCPVPGIAKTAAVIRSVCSIFKGKLRPVRSYGAGVGGVPPSSPLAIVQAGAELKRSVLRLKPKRAIIIDRHLITGGDG
jgi:hypothetical protein